MLKKLYVVSLVLLLLFMFLGCNKKVEPEITLDGELTADFIGDGIDTNESNSAIFVEADPVSLADAEVLVEFEPKSVDFGEVQIAEKDVEQAALLDDYKAVKVRVKTPALKDGSYIVIDETLKDPFFVMCINSDYPEEFHEPCQCGTIENSNGNHHEVVFLIDGCDLLTNFTPTVTGSFSKVFEVKYITFAMDSTYSYIDNKFSHPATINLIGKGIVKK